MIPSASDAGATLLELLVALGIVAGLVAMAASTTVPSPQPPDDHARAARFIADARADAILAGEPGLVMVGAGGLTYEDRRIALGHVVGTARLLVYADGTLAGDTIAFERAAGLRGPSGIPRRGTAHE